MNVTIENDFLKVEIADRGAEMMSLVGKKTGFEYLWQGDAAYWASRATVLFPICGRLTEGKYTWEGRDYEMVLHGFAKLKTYTVVDQKKDSVTFELKQDEETKKMYPFDFIFRVTYSLEADTVRTSLHVKNTGKGELPFSVGGHPGFNVPFVEGEKFEDYYMEFKCVKPVKKLVMSPTCYYTGKKEPFALRDGKFLDLKHELFDNDAIFLDGMCNRVALKSRKNERAVSVHFEDMTHLGFWHRPKTEAPYVCIEPWHGVPAFDGKIDDFATKEEMIHLPEGEDYATYFEVTVTE